MLRWFLKRQARGPARADIFAGVICVAGGIYLLTASPPDWLWYSGVVSTYYASAAGYCVTAGGVFVIVRGIVVRKATGRWRGQERAEDPSAGWLERWMNGPA